MNEQVDVSDIEFEKTPEEESSEEQVEITGRQIYTDQGDPEIDSLYGRYKRGRLSVRPEFQRRFVWDPKKASRLIESALLQIPLPVIYLSEEKDGKVNVIDGQQRLTSFFSYIDGQFPDGKDFKLTKLNVFSELKGKRFKDLDENLQDKIKYCKIRTITFRKESNSDLKFEIFERLNTGAVSLNDQELRNCIYRGKYNRLLTDISTNYDFRRVLGISKPDKRMNDIQLVLRFASFYHATYLNYKPPIRKFLNSNMEKYQDISENDSAELSAAFKNAVQIIYSLFAEHSFKRFHKGDEDDPNGYWEPKKFNASLYDILMFSFAREDKNKVYQHLDEIREALIHLMTNDQSFIDSIELSTSGLPAVTKRFDVWRLTLQSIIGIGQKEPRCFSIKLKEEMMEKDSTCSICGNRIAHIDDSALDHIEQYWKGGRTVPENARLTHRFCNWSRARKEA